MDWMLVCTLLFFHVFQFNKRDPLLHRCQNAFYLSKLGAIIVPAAVRFPEKVMSHKGKQKTPENLLTLSFVTPPYALHFQFPLFFVFVFAAAWRTTPNSAYHCWCFCSTMSGKSQWAGETYLSERSFISGQFCGVQSVLFLESPEILPWF